MIKIISLLLLSLLFLTGCSNSKENTTSNEENTNQSISQTATDVNVTNTSFPEAEENTSSHNTSSNKPIKETELASFTTKIYTKDEERQNNLRLTCSTLNGTVVAKGETFSFTKTIGPSTSSKGYQEADIFDSNGNKKKGLGGGNCQVSSTLYNAVLAVPSLVVVERHEHSNKVPYVKAGKDAAVAYGSVDFKFRNDSSSSIKIYAQTTDSEVTIRLVSI